MREKKNQIPLKPYNKQDLMSHLIEIEEQRYVLMYCYFISTIKRNRNEMGVTEVEASTWGNRRNRNTLWNEWKTPPSESGTRESDRPSSLLTFTHKYRVVLASISADSLTILFSIKSSEVIIINRKRIIKTLWAVPRETTNK